MVEECMISCHTMDSSVDFGLCICTGRAELDSAVRRDTTYLVTGRAELDNAVRCNITYLVTGR